MPSQFSAANTAANGSNSPSSFIWIVVIVFLLCCIICCVVLLFWCRRKRRKKAEIVPIDVVNTEANVGKASGEELIASLEPVVPEPIASLQPAALFPPASPLHQGLPLSAPGDSVEPASSLSAHPDLSLIQTQSATVLSPAVEVTVLGPQFPRLDSEVSVCHHYHSFFSNVQKEVSK